MHRDIKPENILIDSQFNVKVADFGIATFSHNKENFTDYVSTRWYRSPEIMTSKGVYNEKVDVFALGCVMVS